MKEGPGPEIGLNPSNFLMPIVQVGKNYVQARTDTGSDFSIIAKDLAKKLIDQAGIINSSKITLLSAANVQLKIKGHIDTQIDFLGYKLDFFF